MPPQTYLPTDQSTLYLLFLSEAFLIPATTASLSKNHTFPANPSSEAPLRFLATASLVVSDLGTTTGAPPIPDLGTPRSTLSGGTAGGVYDFRRLQLERCGELARRLSSRSAVAVLDAVPPAMTSYTKTLIRETAQNPEL